MYRFTLKEDEVEYLIDGLKELRNKIESRGEYTTQAFSNVYWRLYYLQGRSEGQKERFKKK